MSTTLEQVKWQHNSLLEAFFTQNVGVLELKHAKLNKLLETSLETCSPEEQRYLADVRIFWMHYYCVFFASENWTICTDAGTVWLALRATICTIVSPSRRYHCVAQGWVALNFSASMGSAG